MIRFYFHPTPNPAKIALFLEEAGLAYQTIPIDTSKGEQHQPSFRAINPNGKVPAIIDTDGPGGREARARVFGNRLQDGVIQCLGQPRIDLNRRHRRPLQVRRHDGELAVAIERPLPRHQFVQRHPH